MKAYLIITSLLFLALGGLCTYHLGFGTWEVTGHFLFDFLRPEIGWVAAGVFYSLFVFGLMLFSLMGVRERRLRRREDEVTSLVHILQDGREQQMSLIQMLQNQVGKAQLIKSAEPVKESE